MSINKELITYCTEAARNEVNNFNEDQRDKAQKAIVKHAPVLEKFINGTYSYIGNSSLNVVYADMFGEPVSELEYDRTILEAAITVHIKNLVVGNYLSSGELLAENVFQELYPRLLSSGVIYFIPAQSKFEYTLPEGVNIRKENQLIERVTYAMNQPVNAEYVTTSTAQVIEEDEEDGDVDWE